MTFINEGNSIHENIKKMGKAIEVGEMMKKGVA